MTDPSPMSSPPAIEIERVTFAYPTGPPAPVLQDVSLRVDADDFLGIIGPNGGGKTTLLEIILGLHRPQRGTVRVLGGSPRRTRRHVGYVPQRAHLDPAAPATALDVVLTGRLGSSSWGFRYRAGDVEAALAALDHTGSRDLASRPLRTLSGGQRQRVLIARALASDARILLLDEPTAGVDSRAEEGLTDLLHRLNQRMPVVVVSHDIAFVSAHLKRVACLNRTLTCHAASDISAPAIAAMYHGSVRVVHHEETCPSRDEGAPPRGGGRGA